MTPEEARALREDATPGPWGLERIDGDTHVIFQGMPREPEEWDMPLIAAAPELAELVAGLRYEYAVAGVDNDGKTIPPKTWFPNRYEANIAAMCVNTVETRIVRRLVGDQEVVDE